MRIDGLDHLVVVVADALELVVEVVQPGHELGHRGGAAHDRKGFAEEAADDKPAAVSLAFGFPEHLPETLGLFLVQTEGVLVALRSGFISLSHYYHQLKGGATRERRTGPAGRAVPWSDTRSSPEDFPRSSYLKLRFLSVVGCRRVSMGRVTMIIAAVRAGCAPGAILR